MIFYKTSSAGNDFIQIDVRDFPASAADKSELARIICDAHRAVGADGVVYYRAEKDDFFFEIYNRDGGEAELSGNGMAGLAAVLFQRRLASSPLRLQTGIGERCVEFLARDGPIYQLNVEIGQPDFSQRKFFPFLKDKQTSYVIDGQDFCPVSVGNPHAVVLCREERTAERLLSLGKKLASHEWFPAGVNVEFVFFKGESDCRVFFHERGVGATRSSSTGSAAVFAVLRRLGLVNDHLLIDCGTDKIAVSWKQGIFIHNFTRLICRGNYF